MELEKGEEKKGKERKGKERKQKETKGKERYCMMAEVTCSFSLGKSHGASHKRISLFSLSPPLFFLYPTSHLLFSPHFLLPPPFLSSIEHKSLFSQVSLQSHCDLNDSWLIFKLLPQTHCINSSSRFCSPSFDCLCHYLLGHWLKNITFHRNLFSSPQTYISFKNLSREGDRLCSCVCFCLHWPSDSKHRCSFQSLINLDANIYFFLYLYSEFETYDLIGSISTVSQNITIVCSR